MSVLPKSLIVKIRKLYAYDIVYASFWLAVLVVVFFFPVMIGRQSLAQAVPIFYSHPSPVPAIQIPWQVDAGTHTAQTIPLVKAGVQMAKDGIAPLWAAYWGYGQPFAGDLQSGLSYPLRFLFFFLWDSARAFDWYFLLRFFIAGLGMFLYLRIVGLRRIVALWGGIGYAFTGYFMLYLSYPFLDIDSLLPWTFWAVERYVMRRNLNSAAPVGVFLAMSILTGHPQSAIIAFCIVALYFIWRTVRVDVRVGTERGRSVKKYWPKTILHALFIGIVALLIALPFIADFLVHWQQGKTIAAYETKGLLNFPLLHLLHFLITPTMMPEVAASGHLFDAYYLIIPYAGLSVTLLFLLSIFIKKWPPQLAPLYAWIAFVILKNAGFPLVQWIGKLPILNQVGWHKAYGPMAGAVVICGAIAFEHMLRGKQGEETVRWRGFYGLLAAIPLVFIAAYMFAPDAFVQSYVPNFDFFNRGPEIGQRITALIAGWPGVVQKFVLYVMQNHGGYFTILLFSEALVFGLATLAVIHFLRQPRVPKRAVAALILLTAFELWWYMPKIRDGFHYLDPYAHTPPYVSFLQNQTEKEGVSRIFSFGNILSGGTGELYKIQQSQHTLAVKLRRYFAFLPDEILREDSLTGAIAADKLPDVPQKFFDAYSIRYLLSEHNLPDEPWLKLIYNQDIKIYENQNALPKAYIVFQKEIAASPDEARKLFYDAPFDPHHAVILEDRGAINLSEATAAPHIPATVARYLDNEVDLTVQTSRDGILVLTDVFYPGWQAYLDGKKVPIYPANVMFRGIFLPAGDHEIRFSYEPPWFWPSMVVSIATMLGVFAFLGYGGFVRARPRE